METGRPHTVQRLHNGVWVSVQRDTVRELLLTLKVNGQELVTLTASPHNLNELVIGFLHLQGLIKSPEDLLSLGSCADQSTAEVQIRGDLPGSLALAWEALSTRGKRWTAGVRAALERVGDATRDRLAEIEIV